MYTGLFCVYSANWDDYVTSTNMINEDGQTEQIPNKIPNFDFNGFKITLKWIFQITALKTFYLIQILTLNFPIPSEIQGPGIGLAFYCKLGRSCPNCFQTSSWPIQQLQDMCTCLGEGLILLNQNLSFNVQYMKLDY